MKDADLPGNSSSNEPVQVLLYLTEIFSPLPVKRMANLASCPSHMTILDNHNCFLYYAS